MYILLANCHLFLDDILIRRYVMAELRLKGGVLWFDKVCN